MDIANRLKLLIKSLGLSYKDFARKTNIPYPTLQHYLTGQRQPNTESMIKICLHTKANLHWLLTGEGEMFRPESKDEGCIQINKNEDFTIWAVVQMLKEMSEEQRQAILKHIEKEKLLQELLKERQTKQ